MTGKELKNIADRIKHEEQGIKLIEDMLKTLGKMNKLNGCIDIDNCISKNGYFSDEFLTDLRAVKREKEDFINTLTIF